MILMGIFMTKTARTELLGNNKRQPSLTLFLRFCWVFVLFCFACCFVVVFSVLFLIYYFIYFILFYHYFFFLGGGGSFLRHFDDSSDSN